MGLNDTKTRTFAPSAASPRVHEDVLEHETTLFVGALILDALHESVLEERKKTTDDYYRRATFKRV